MTELRAAVAMRSAGQVLAVRLLDREMWHCQHVDKVPYTCSSSSSGSGSIAVVVVVVVVVVVSLSVCMSRYPTVKVVSLPCYNWSIVNSLNVQ